MELHERKNYTADIDFMLSNYIREYDIKQANINILYREGYLSKEQYTRLLDAPRMYRQKTIGWVEKDKEVLNILDRGLVKARLDFFSSNGLSEDDILAIKNDAIYVINKIPKEVRFDNVEYVNKNTYSSYIRLFNRLEVYHFSDMVNHTQLIDVKGINDKKLEYYHKDYMLSIISDFLYDMGSNQVELAIGGLKEFYCEYINKVLPKEFYRTFNSESVYLIKTHGILETDYGVDAIKDDELRYVDISYNMNIIREMWKIASMIYFKNNR